MRRMLLHSTLGTVFVFLVLLGIAKISQLEFFNAFDPLGKAFSDMEITDIAFSQLREDPKLDTNVVIVNIGNLSRAEVAQQIMNVSRFSPKVIGIDSFFDCPAGLRDSINCPMAYDTLGNTLLRFAIEQAGNVVLVTKVLQSDSLLNALGADIDVYDSLERTDLFIRGDAMEGFANLETDAANQEDLKVCRRFVPTLDVAGKQELAFSVRVAMLFDSVKTQSFMARKNRSEVINYRGNIIDWFGASQFPGRYYTLDWDQALDTESFAPGLFKDKIVLMGFLGGDIRDTSWDDKFFTPLNKQYAGKTRPDMFGVVVHANIISMILSEDYVKTLPEWQSLAIAIIVCFVNVALFWLIMQRIPDWFDGLSILFQIIQFLTYSFLIVMFFAWDSLKLELTVTLAVTALVGNSFELYHNVLLYALSKMKESRLYQRFTRREEKVLTQ